jgi:hypothetical protein
MSLSPSPSPSPTQSLDHLVLFLPCDPTTSLPLIPPFLTQNFTLTPGGVHADGITSNTLILLADGCYIELISFIDPGQSAEHWWGPNASFVGWKDWCLTNELTPEENYEHVGEGEGYAEPVRGGRKKADGVDVWWAVTFPKGEKGGQVARGRVPFFCHDVTPRSVRVPIDKEKTTHSCGAVGVRKLTVGVKDQGTLDETKKVYESILKSGRTGTEGGGEVRFRLRQVHQVHGLDAGARIVLRLPENEEERIRVEKQGFWFGNVILSGKAGPGKAVGTKERLDGRSGEGSVGGLWIEYI